MKRVIFVFTFLFTMISSSCQNPTITGDQIVCHESEHIYVTEPGMTNYIWILYD